MTKSQITFAKLVLGSLFLWLVSRQIDWRKFLNLWLTLDYIWLLGFCLLYPFSVWLSTQKWQQLLNHYQFKFRFTQLYKLYWLGSFFNTFLPTDFGGDVYKFAQLAKTSSQKIHLASSIFLERFFGFVAMLVVILVCGLPFVIQAPTEWFYVGYLMVAVSFLTTLGLTYLGKFIIRLKPAWKEQLTSLFALPQSLKFRCLVISVLFVVQSAAGYWFLFKALHAPIDFWLLLAWTPLTNLTGLIPLTPNGLGIRESVGLFIFQFFAIGPEVTLSALFLARILLLGLNAVGSLLLSLKSS